ncbi:hypothetical protein LINPERHAP1_LOCUS13955 [Linum perenne]
MILRTTPMQL